MDCLKNLLWSIQNLWSAVGFELATSCFLTAVTPDACVIHDANDSADLNCAHHGHFQEFAKKTPFIELNIYFFEIPFQRKKVTRPLCNPLKSSSSEIGFSVSFNAFFLGAFLKTILGKRKSLENVNKLTCVSLKTKEQVSIIFCFLQKTGFVAN